MLASDAFSTDATAKSLEEYPLTTWRLLNTGSADGATNMAIAEAILTAVAEGGVRSLRCASLPGNHPASPSAATRQRPKLT